MPVIGIDLDNTIIDYRGVFYRHAVRKGLIPETVGHGKDDVRDFLRAAGREDDFTELQGFIYGPGLVEAKPFDGVRDAWAALQTTGARLAIVSHKTPKPYLGPPYDLQAFAREWLSTYNLVGQEPGQVNPADVFLEPTKAAKLARIIELACTWFIDDLPEFLGEPAFPAYTRRILFDPDRRAGPDTRWHIVHDWSAIPDLIRIA